MLPLAIQSLEGVQRGDNLGPLPHVWSELTRAAIIPFPASFLRQALQMPLILIYVALIRCE